MELSSLRIDGLWAMSLLHPALLLLGGVLLVAPILIHWFSRRRVRVVEWAAMDLLLGAYRRDQRRVRLENWVLLALRCLLIGLLAFMVARPRLDRSQVVLGDAAEAVQFVAVLDDSLSMQAQAGNVSSFELARRQLEELGAARSELARGDTLTVFVTSRPESPLVAELPLTPQRWSEAANVVQALSPSDQASPLGESLASVRRWLASRPTVGRRQVVLWTDARERDWSNELPADVRPTTELAALVADGAEGLVCDVGGREIANVQVTRVEHEPLLAAGVPTRMDVAIRNLGPKLAADLQLMLTIGNAPPQPIAVPKVEAGGEVVVSVPLTLTSVDFDAPDRRGASEATRSLDQVDDGPRWVTLDVRLASQQPAVENRLLGDDRWQVVVPVWPAVPVLLVDGKPTSRDGRGATYFLNAALAPEGVTSSGLQTKVTTVESLESFRFESFRAVFLCDVFRLPAASLEALASWTRAGGLLVVLPGEQLDPITWNRTFGAEGAGLSPLVLDAREGDETRQSWRTLGVPVATSSLMPEFAGADNPLLQRVQVFRWWAARAEGSSGATRVETILELSGDNSNAARPAAATWSVGHGRVVMFTFPADDAWSNWPTEPSFVVFWQMLIPSLGQVEGREALLAVGQPLRWPVELARFEPTATWRAPDDRRWVLTAEPATSTDVDRTPPTPGEAPAWQFTTRETRRSGIYELELTSTNGQPEIRRVAANVAPAEGELERTDLTALRRVLAASRVRLVASDELEWTEGDGVGRELWPLFAWSVLGLLLLEPWFAWRVERRR